MKKIPDELRQALTDGIDQAAAAEPTPDVFGLVLPTTVVGHAHIRTEQATTPDGRVTTLVMVATCPQLQTAPGLGLPLHRYELRLDEESRKALAGMLSGGVVIP